MAIESNKVVVPKDFTNTFEFGVNHFNDNSKNSSISFNYESEGIYPFDMVFERHIEYASTTRTELWGTDVGSGWGNLGRKTITYTIDINIDSNYLEHYRFFRFVLNPNIVATKFGNGSLSFELLVNIIVNGDIKDSINNNFKLSGYVINDNYGSGAVYRADKYSFIYDSITEELTDDSKNGTECWGDLYGSTATSEVTNEE